MHLEDVLVGHEVEGIRVRAVVLSDALAGQGQSTDRSRRSRASS